MRQIRTLWPCLRVLAALAMTCAVQAQSQSQSQSEPPAQQSTPPADVAAKPKEAKAGTAPKKVYTNDDLSSMQPAGVSTVGNTKSTAKPVEAKANQSKNEQYWRNRAQDLHNKMAEVDRQIAQNEAASQNASANAGSSNGANPPPPSAYTVGAHVRAISNPALQRLKDKKAQLQQQMDQLEDEARKANVPPGWLR